jgi:acyl-coenzyme A synthetase/AMP-(fatty) acid ligase
MESQGSLPKDAALGFLTSGSTGEARVVWKSESCLVDEARLLARLFLDAAPPGLPVVALVPPCHLFGFLFAALVPGLAGRATCHVEPGTPPERVPEAALLVSVPSLFPYVEELLVAGRVRGAVVFSGAPLGEERRARARAARGLTLRTASDEFELLNAPLAGEGVYEVLGSTETGGLGVSDARTAQAAFRLLPGVELMPDTDEAGAWYVRSPFSFPPCQPLALGDRLLALPDGTFLHKGRVDRVFKYGGRRFSLAHIEERLAALSGSARCLCFFFDDATHAKGGRLVAFLERGVVPGPSSAEALRRAWVGREGLPFPHILHWLDVFPVDALGKTSFRKLLQEVTHGR